MESSTIPEDLPDNIREAIGTATVDDVRTNRRGLVTFDLRVRDGWPVRTLKLAPANDPFVITVGATDDLGFKAVTDRCHVSDLHATILHLMGLDYTRLSYPHLGLAQRLTGVEERHIVTQALS